MSRPNFHPAYLATPVAILLFLTAILAFKCAQIVPPGHQGVKVLFGSVNPVSVGEGFHWANPLTSWVLFDCRKRTEKIEEIGVPSKDKLTTIMDVSVQYHLNPGMVAAALSETGTAEQLLEVHLLPKVRSLLREQGKGVEQAEMFYQEEIQQSLQISLRDALAEYCSPKGIVIDEVLLRDIELPEVIRTAVTQTKERQEQTAREAAEFERYEIEQKKIVAEAQAKRQAAEEEAAQIRLLAEAKAFDIEAQGTALRQNPEMLQLMALEQWDGVMPRVMSGKSELPFLMMLGEDPK